MHELATRPVRVCRTALCTCGSRMHACMRAGLVTIRRSQRTLLLRFQFWLVFRQFQIACSKRTLSRYAVNHCALGRGALCFSHRFTHTDGVYDCRQLRQAQGTVTRPFEPVYGASAWTAADYRDHPDKWTYRLSVAELAELDAAVHAVQESGREIQVNTS